MIVHILHLLVYVHVTFNLVNIVENIVWIRAPMRSGLPARSCKNIGLDIGLVRCKYRADIGPDNKI